MSCEVLRYTAFTLEGTGGNPAGVVLDAAGLDAPAMQAVAAEVGLSETVFVTGTDGDALRVRYFSPRAEVAFCGHATVALAVALAERDGPGHLRLLTAAGEVPVDTQDAGGEVTATLTSVPPVVRPVTREIVERALAALGWQPGDLDRRYPPVVAGAGVDHLVLVAATRTRLADLHHDVPALEALAAEQGWTTLQLVWAEGATVFRSRNPFPAGGVVEDPATGAAAAALGGYLRELQLVDPPVQVLVVQGEDMGRPSRLLVDVPAGSGGIRVTGAAARLP
ncbi:PhzF family phenazine biosynthesis protein [Angustibacter aerolatus]